MSFRVITDENNTYLTLKDDDGKIKPLQIMIFSKCLSNDTMIETPNGKIKLGNLPLNKEFLVKSYNLKEKKIEINKAIRIDSGKKQLYEITTKNGNKIKASADHKFFVADSYFFIYEQKEILKIDFKQKKLQNLKVNDLLYIKNNVISQIESRLDRFIALDKIISIKKIEIEETSDLTVEKNHNFFANNFLVLNSGTGKGLFSEAIAETLHDAGYLILVLSDSKGEIEWGYQMWKPEEKYHLEELRKQGQMLEEKKIKLYHPFTFNLLHNRLLPDINFYTLSLKDMRRPEWSMIAESEWDSDTIKLLMDASQSIRRDEGIYSMLHYIQEKVRGKKEKREIKADPDNFYLNVTSGTMKSLQDVANYFKTFKKDWFLDSDDSPLNLNMKDILSDREHYHVFFYRWLKDNKLKEFTILALFNLILENRDYIKYPICVVIPEIKYLTPFKAEGYKKFLAQGLKDHLSTMRNIGKGFSSIADAQTFSEVDEAVRSSATDIFFGEIGSPSDIEKIGKAMHYRRDILEYLNNMEGYNMYILKGQEKLGTWTGWIPRSMHCEPHYNFFEMYAKKSPEKMRKYDGIIEMMKKRISQEKDKIRDRITNKEKEIKKQEQEKRQEREKPQEAKVEKYKQKATQIESEFKLDLMKRCYEMKQEGKSNRQIAKELEKVSYVTVGNYIKDYEKKLLEETQVQENQTKENFEEKEIEPENQL